MWNFIKQFIRFRVGQKMSRNMASSFGLRGIAPLIGLYMGYRYMRRHS